MFRAGDPLEHISLITKGDVEASSGGYTFMLAQSDVMGISDIKHGKYTYTYKALSDTDICKYPFKNIDAMDVLVQQNPDSSYLMVTYMCRYIARLSAHINRLRREIEAVPPLINDLSEEYSRLCKLYKAPRSTLPLLPDGLTRPESENVPKWMHSYYTEISDLGVDARKIFFRGNTGITVGFLRICAQDASGMYALCESLHSYLSIISKQLLSSSDADLFSLVSQLHVSVVGNEGADFAVDALMASLNGELTKLADLHAVSPEYYHKCLKKYFDDLEESRAEFAAQEDMSVPNESSSVLVKLDGNHGFMGIRGSDSAPAVLLGGPPIENPAAGEKSTVASGSNNSITKVTGT